MFYNKKAYYLITLIIFCYQLPSYCLESSPKIYEEKIGNPITLTNLLLSIKNLYVSENNENFNNLNKQAHKNTQPTDKKEGWSEWQSWTNFPHNQIQLGVSNSDYGAMMDMEYKCFNKVSPDNDEKKSQTYWYRISEPTELSEYVKIEIGCWLENQLKAVSLVNGIKINTSSKSEPELYAQDIYTQDIYSQDIYNCPREFTGWDLIKSFETKNYSLALCQQGDSVYLVGHEKDQHEAFITANVISQNNDLIIAQDEYGFSFEINNHELKVTQNNQLIAQEKILDLYIKQNNSESNLTGVVWQLQQIRYNNDELIKVDNPSNYTIEFLPDGQVQIKADCNRARGTYTQQDSSISIKIGPTTRAMCPPESISDQYLKELQSAVIFFFQDGNLYFDLKFDTGTMKFIPDTSKLETEKKLRILSHHNHQIQ